MGWVSTSHGMVKMRGLDLSAFMALCHVVISMAISAMAMTAAMATT